WRPVFRPLFYSPKGHSRPAKTAEMTDFSLYDDFISTNFLKNMNFKMPNLARLLLIYPYPQGNRRLQHETDTYKRRERVFREAGIAGRSRCPSGLALHLPAAQRQAGAL